ncbi:MAG: isoaspartyl peptidase/L-asparaginase [Bacillota bacterium]|nr:isoaspartyl peptidase/L-asparaginase [Bacillota bacterium]
MAGIVVHGGAGHVEDPDGLQRAGVEKAARAGWEVLSAGGSALEAVLAAVRTLEDDPHFNAGTGAVLNLAGEAEMDAAVATGEGGFGAVAALTRVRHPVDVARAVMDETDHLLLAGQGALEFARARGFEPYNPVTVERLERWQRDRQLLESGRSTFWPKLARRAGHEARYSTVGAVAVDAEGRVAAATSTGGISLKLPGRVGDTPVMGAGTFASPLGAASATGHGEGILRLGLTRLAVERMEREDAMEAVRAAIDLAGRAGVEAGLIGVDARGGLGFAFNTAGMARAWAGERGIEAWS